MNGKDNRKGPSKDLLSYPRHFPCNITFLVVRRQLGKRDEFANVAAFNHVVFVEAINVHSNARNAGKQTFTMRCFLTSPNKQKSDLMRTINVIVKFIPKSQRYIISIFYFTKAP